MFAIFLVSLASHIGQAETSTAQPPTTEQIAVAIEQLGDERFAVREEATKFLWRAGHVAKSALERAANSEDREVSYRAGHILDRFRLGIFPDTPPEVIALINQYRNGDENLKGAVLGQLNALKRLDTMLALLGNEKDENLKQRLAQRFVSTASKAIEQAIVDGEYQRVAELLEWLASFDRIGTQLRSYAALLLLHTGLDDKIAELKASPNLDDHADQMRMLAHLLKVKREFAEAREFAIKTADKKLVADLNYRLNDWKSLTLPGSIPGDGGIENLGFSAAFFGLAKNKDESQKAIDAIIRLAAETDVSEYMCAEALMISDRWQAAIDLQREKRPINSFRILCEQARFAEAFELIKLKDPTTKSVQWFMETTKSLDPASKEMSSHFSTGLQVAQTLYRLNERDKALQLLDELKKTSMDTNGGRLRTLVSAELKMGLKDLAFKHATVSLSDPAQRSSMLNTLFRTHAKAADIFWQHFVLTTTASEDRTALQKLDELLQPTEGQLSAGELKSIIDGALQHAPPLGDNKQKAVSMQAIAKVCQTHEQWELAQTYVKKEWELQPSAECAIRVGDLFGKLEQWQEAATYYERAWKLEKGNALALYLHGHAHRKLGDEDRANALVKLATVLPLADIVKRQTLAAGLAQREMLDAAREQWELMLLLGPFDSWEGSQAWAVRDAARNIGYYIAEEDPLRSAALRRRRIFYLLKTNSSFIDIEYYARVMHLIHKSQAQGLLKAEKTDEAIKEIWLAHKARPDEVDLVLDLIEKLKQAEREEAADELFKKTYEVYERVCGSFPNSAHHHNNLAWLSARTQRRLDDALRHAHLAVALRPGYAAYVDTLAETHFQVGNREMAIKFSKQAIELEPDNEFFKEQLERFRGK